MMGLPGGVEWIVILVIALLLFGKRLPNVMRSLGQGVKEFKRGVNTVEDEVDSIEESAEPSSGELPEGEYGEYEDEYQDEYTEEGYQYQEPGAPETEEGVATEEPAAPENEEEDQTAAGPEETSKPTG